MACHGIPDLRPLQEGDVVSYDCTAYLNGFFGVQGGETHVFKALECSDHGHVNVEKRYISACSNGSCCHAAGMSFQVLCSAGNYFG